MPDPKPIPLATKPIHNHLVSARVLFTTESGHFGLTVTSPQRAKVHVGLYDEKKPVERRPLETLELDNNGRTITKTVVPGSIISVDVGEVLGGTVDTGGRGVRMDAWEVASRELTDLLKLVQGPK